MYSVGDIGERTPLDPFSAFPPRLSQKVELSENVRQKHPKVAVNARSPQPSIALYTVFQKTGTLFISAITLCVVDRLTDLKNI